MYHFVISQFLSSTGLILNFELFIDNILKKKKMSYTDMDSGTWARYKIENDERTAYINHSIEVFLIMSHKHFVRLS